MAKSNENASYHTLMEKIITGLADGGKTGSKTPKLLLHSCCAPCSTAVIAALSSFFRITVFYFNPNIDDRAEYEKRAREQERLISLMPTPNQVSFLEGEYDPENFHEVARSHENDREGAERCTLCYALRLDETARTARARDFDFFTTTLSVSPMKDAKRINTIGSALGKKHGVAWLWSDFKKKDGYKKSIDMSREYNLYRQNYCGCSYSRRDSDRELV